LEQVKFDGKLEFKKNPVELDMSILGSLAIRHLTFSCENLKGITFSNQIVQHCLSGLHLFKHENQTNQVFYFDTKRLVHVVNFDNSGKVINQIQNLFDSWQMHTIKVIRLGNKFVMCAYFYQMSSIYSYRGQAINGKKGPCCLLLIVESDLKYIKHIPLNSVYHMTANSSKLVCLDSANTFSCYDLNLKIVQSQELIKAQN
jgi:hypothetical protein